MELFSHVILAAGKNKIIKHCTVTYSPLYRLKLKGTVSRDGD
jgi:hypothetical protein